MPTNYKRFHAILSTCGGVGNPDFQRLQEGAAPRWGFVVLFI